MAISGGFQIDADSLAGQSARLERAGAVETIRWAREQFGSRIALACSFQDCVIVDLAMRVDPKLEVIFLDTGFHFPETLEFVKVAQARYRLNLTVVHPDASADPWPCGSSQCCQRRKVDPLFQSLKGRLAWITGLKRCDAPTRAYAPVLGWDEARQMVKVNPVATWTESDIARYGVEHDLPKNPLTARGYLSIGCAPTTRPVAPNEGPRAGRWSDSEKTECGLHS